ncbi:hypothetical protein EST38_g2080 [Candolleomyces aberdarensis]|uniref:Bromo domain-containing protein n=1 Tax=Candolleomyces aberdarensis TaxID=2316362 RepID=A0A4Q2DU59_9AGAR|nr:hypothetical protein EST38_g2080 [Candolleomyces aberdarensis]
MSSAFSSNNDHRAPLKAASSGLKLVLPPLKSVLEAKNKKAKPRSGSISFPSPAVQDVVEIVEKKPPRPVKLKPLKEVLGKLIQQIKKKDDYAFFLAPVDAENVPGYLDVVKCPMDLGTMTEKVNRGRYRSLDDFANDLRLVTTNAKIFNPPGSIYYTEAERIEAWGLDHINKAAGTVVQHESDWNIDIEREDDTPTTVQVEPMEEEEDRMDVDEQSRARSVSVLSQPQPGSTRRGPRGPYKKNAQANTPQISESIDSEGRLPGSKDGVGAFPPQSDWAKMMLSLKLKGKKYKTKKERMKIEKEGPPTLPEGSLDYTEMEDPFSVLCNLVPDSPSRPALAPLYPPLFSPPQETGIQPSISTSSIDGKTPQSQSSTYPAAISVPLDYTLPEISSGTKFRHWTISRNVNPRQKAKDKDDEPETTESPPWQVPRELHAADFGSFSLLAGALADEMRRRGMTPCTVQDGQEQEIHFDWIRDDIEASQAEQPESYVHDMVYGGVDGLAYVRSLAEFMRYTPSEAVDYEEDVKEEVNILGLPLANINANKMDMAALINHREELYLSEEEWLGKELRERRTQEASAARAKLGNGDTMEGVETANTAVKDDPQSEGPEELKEVLDYVAAMIVDINHRTIFKIGPPSSYQPNGHTLPLPPAPAQGKAVKQEEEEEEEEEEEANAGAKPVPAPSQETIEDPLLRNLRLNLLALAKRAPLDTLDLSRAGDKVPEDVRSYLVASSS